MALLDVQNILMYCQTRKSLVRAVKSVSIELESSESIGLVGVSDYRTSDPAYSKEIPSFASCQFTEQIKHELTVDIE